MRRYFNAVDNITKFSDTTILSPHTISCFASLVISNFRQLISDTKRTNLVCLNGLFSIDFSFNFLAYVNPSKRPHLQPAALHM